MRASRRRRLVRGTIFVSIIILDLEVIVLQPCRKLGTSNVNIEIVI